MGRLIDYRAFGFLLIAMSPICVGETLVTLECPTSRLSWKRRAQNFTCNTQKGIAYHCILDETDRLVETCVVRIPLPPGKVGCPQVGFDEDGISYHVDDNTECPTDNVYCPSADTAYFSDQLYLYPICFLNISARAEYTEETSETINKSTEKRDSENSKCEECGSDSCKNPMTAVILLAIILSVSLVANGISCFIIRRGKLLKDLIGV